MQVGQSHIEDQGGLAYVDRQGNEGHGHSGGRKGDVDGQQAHPSLHVAPAGVWLDIPDHRGSHQEEGEGRDPCPQLWQKAGSLESQPRGCPHKKMGRVSAGQPVFQGLRYEAYFDTGAWLHKKRGCASLRVAPEGATGTRAV